MLTVVWSVKGGTGCTVVAASLAMIKARDQGRCIVVDLAGDLPAALGMAEPGGPGVTEWLASAEGDAESLERLLVSVHAGETGSGLDLLPVGAGREWPPDRADRLVSALRTLGVPVVVDAGHVEGGPEHRWSSALHAVGRRVRDAGTSLLVMRPCYLALRRAVGLRAEADGVVLVRDSGRALDRRDIADVLDLPVVAAVDVDPAVARAVDAGVLTRRLPRAMERQLRSAA